MLKEQFILATAFVLLALTCASAQTQSPAQSPAQPPAQQPTPSSETANESNGAIVGLIVNERGEPMPGASVFVRPINAPNAGRSSSADAEGRFRLTGLEAGLYIVSGYAPAYVSQPPAEDTPTTYYRLGDSVRIEMFKGGVITGTVTNATGEPVVGIRVRALRARDTTNQAVRTLQYGFVERTTDDRGVYRIYGLMPGTYVVSAGGSGGNQSYQLNPYEGDVGTFSPSSTRDTATELSVRSGEETTADIRYRSDAGRTISGTVKTTGNNGATIALMPIDGGFMPAGNAFQSPGARGFELSGVGDGEYYIVGTEFPTNINAMTTALPDLSISEPKRISVRGADITGIELVPRPSASMAGRIALEPSKAPECQGKRKPLLAETLVDLIRNPKDAETTPAYMRMMAGATTPDAKGGFAFRNLMAGRYRLDPQFYARFWYLQSISIGSPSPAAPTAAKTAAPPRLDPAANWITLKPGEKISDLTVTLAEGAASIRGKIPVAEGSTIPAGTAVFLVPAETEKAADVLRYFISNVGSDGTFALNSLPPGRYWSLLQNPVQTELATLLKLRSPESAEARTKLRRAAESQKSDVELKPCQTVADYQLSFK